MTNSVSAESQSVEAMDSYKVRQVRLRNNRGIMHAAYVKGRRGAVTRARTEDELHRKMLGFFETGVVDKTKQSSEAASDQVFDDQFPEEFGVDIEREIAIEFSDELETL
jgi:hypothetical protein